MERIGKRSTGRAGFLLLSFLACSLFVAPSLRDATAAETREKAEITQGDRALMLRADESRVLKLDRPAGTVLLSDPVIASVLVKEPSMLLVSGRSYGVTSLTILDSKSEEIARYTLHVRERMPDPSLVTLYRGRARETMSCVTSECQPVAKVGDHGDYLKWVIDSVNARTELVNAAGQDRR